MASLTPEQVRHIAQLARLTLSPEEVATYTTELANILKYVEMLTEVDTSGVEPTSQVTGQVNSLRTDVVYAHPLASPANLLATSPLPIEDNQIETPSAHG